MSTNRVTVGDPIGQRAKAASVSVTLASDQDPVDIAGTVTADAGTGPWPVTDNGGSLTVDGPLTDTQLRAVAVPVSGTFWQATQPVSGPLTDTELRASPVDVSGPLTDTELRAAPVEVDGSGVTQPVSGTVTVANPTADPETGLAKDATLTTTNTEIGATNETAPASDTATSGLNGRLQRIAQRLTSILAKIPAFGTAGTPSADVVTVQGKAAMTPLLVDGSGATQPVSGTVTANAGTNLNTSLLATESGGNLAAAAASLSVLDDWDESDRAKVNPIVGQAGVQGGSGGVSALTQRVVLATDVALPAGTNAIGKLAANSGVYMGDVDVTSLPNVTLAAGTNTNEVVGDVAHDAPAAGNPLLMGGYAKAAAPADVSADADAVRSWHLLNGAQATVITAAGALVGGDASNGLDVDVTRLPALVASSANIGDVDVLTVPAPLSTTGGGSEATALRVTVATDSTGVLSVDDNGGNLSVDDGGGTLTVDYATTGSGNATGALRVELANNGTGVLATVGAVTAITNALPAGTNAIGKLAANSGVDIGDVDVTSLPRAATGTESSVAGSASNVTLLAANANRLGASIFNDSTAILYVRLSATAATTSTFTVKLVAGAYYELPGPFIYTGQINGIWASATGNARVTELTA